MTNGIDLLTTAYTAVHNTSATAPTSGTIRPFACKDGNHRIAWYVKGANASSSGNIVFTLQVTMDKDAVTGTDWRNLATVTIALSGTAQIVDTTSYSLLDLTGWRWVRLATVANSDTTYDATVNATIRPANSYVPA